MRRTIILLIAVSLVAATGIGAAEEGDPPEEANYGLCTAQENSEEGNENSNGTVQETPPFSSLDEEDCEDAEPPGPGDNPGDGQQPDDPGSGEDEGSDEDPSDGGEDPPQDGDT